MTDKKIPQPQKTKHPDPETQCAVNDKSKTDENLKSKKDCPYKKTGRRTFIVIIEVLAVLFLLLAVCIGVFVWRISTKPLDLTFAKPYIEDALQNPQTGIKTDVNKIVLHWPDMKGPLMLGLQGVKILNADNKTIIQVKEAALGLSKRRLVIGRIAPKALIVTAPTLTVTRDKTGEFDIGFGALSVLENTDAAQYEQQKSIIETVFDILVDDRQAPDHKDSPLSTLRTFQITDANLTFEDETLKRSWTFADFDILFEKAKDALNIDLNLKVPPVNPQNPSANLAAQAIVSKQTREVSLKAGLSGLRMKMLARDIPNANELSNQRMPFDAQVDARFDENLNPIKAALILNADEGVWNIPEFSDDPIPFENLNLNVAYNRDTQKVDLQKLSVTTKTVPIMLKGQATLDSVKSPAIVDASLRADIQTLPQDKIAPLWPKDLKEDNAHEWIVEKLSAGTFSNVYATLDIQAKKHDVIETVPTNNIDKGTDQPIEQPVANSWTITPSNIKAGFDFENMDINYRAPLMPVTQANGTGVFDYDQQTLDMQIVSAKLGDMDIKSAQLGFIDIIKKGAGEADITIDLNGPVKTALAFIKDDPINAKIDTDIEKVKGNANLNLNIQFPTINDIKTEQVKISIDGMLTNAYLPDVVQGMALSGEALSLSVKENKAIVKGSAKLADRSVDLIYEEFLESEGKPYKSKVKAKIIADPNLRERFGIDISDFIEGSAPIDVTYTKFHGQKSRADVRVDLTPARLFLDPFDYNKRPGETASGSLSAYLENEKIQKISDLQVVAPNLKINNADIIFRKQGNDQEISHGQFSGVTIGETTGIADFEITKDNVLKMVINSQTFDLRPFLNDDAPDNTKDQQAVIVSLTADTLRASDDQTVTQAKAYVDIDGQGRFNQLEFDSNAGKGDIYLRYKPDEQGKRTFILEASDAGATLRAFDLYDKVQGGKIRIYGEPKGGLYDRNINGVAEISNFRVVNAPALARLLSAMSLPGVLNLLGNEGVSFTRLETRFEWQYRPEGSVIFLKDGRTSGNSLGLTFAGSVDQQAGMVDINGTLVPISGINKFIGDIPLLGDIVTGGSGALFAATYTMKGKAEDPKVSVNPLSVLAPGIIRRILFEEE